MSGAEELGRGGRLRGAAAGELVAAAYAAESAHGPRLAHGLSLADLAHAVALVEGGDLAGEDAKALLRGLLELHAIPGDEFPWDPRSATRSTRARPSSSGASAARPPAGSAPAGRGARRSASALRLTARAGDARAARRARRPGRRARAPRARDGARRSRPTTPISSRPSRRPSATCCSRTPTRRCATPTRARASTPRSARASPARAAAPAHAGRSTVRGSPSCSAATALVEHAKDAAWQADVYVELLATLAIAATHQSQLGQDFEIYASQEFGLVELADAHSRASALMPQKKNPYALAAIRTQAGQAAGDLAGALVALHTGSARTDHFHLLNGSDPARARRGGRDRAADRVGARRHRAARRALRADRARELRHRRRRRRRPRARAASIDYRSAHKVVGRAVRDLVEAGEPPSELTPARLSAAAEAAIGRPVAIDEATLRDALDPAACAAARRQTGSSSAAAMDGDARRHRRDPRRARRLERGRAGARDGRRGRAARPRPRARFLKEVVLAEKRRRHGTAQDLRKADQRDDVAGGDLAVVELAEIVRQLVDAAELGIVVLDLTRESSPSVFTSTLSITASKIRSRGL